MFIFVGSCTWNVIIIISYSLFHKYTRTYLESGLFNESRNHCKPSNRPSPVVAVVACTCHRRLPRVCNSNFSVTSATDMACGRSCLFANTKTHAFLNSSSVSIFFNSLQASLMRSRSLESTTKMIPTGLNDKQKSSRAKWYLECFDSNGATMNESCLDLRRPKC